MILMRQVGEGEGEVIGRVQPENFKVGEGLLGAR